MSTTSWKRWNVEETCSSRCHLEWLLEEGLVRVILGPPQLWSALCVSFNDISWYLISYHFQNIVKISLSHFFWTISHDIYLISTHTESPYWWIKVPIGEAIFRWKWHKKSKYTPHKWSLTGKYRFPKKYNIRAFLPIVTSRQNALLEEEKCKFWTYLRL